MMWGVASGTAVCSRRTTPAATIIAISLPVGERVRGAIRERAAIGQASHNQQQALTLFYVTKRYFRVVGGWAEQGSDSDVCLD